VLPFEILPFEAPVPEPARRAPTVSGRALPLYVAPLAEESLFSWLHRLATRLGTSFHTLASHSFGIEDRAGRTTWWHRPHPWALARISQRTGVALARLRQMTFEDFQPVYRDDEDSGRFAGRRYDCRAPEWRAYRFGICGACLEADAVPYLRSIWHIGWLAVCPTHGTILLTRCAHCRCAIRVPQLSVSASFSPTTCDRCGENLLAQRQRMAHPAVVQLQQTLLGGKRHGVTEIAGLGTFTWQEAVALVDILLGMIWTHTTLEERNGIWLRYEYESLEQPRTETHFYDCRHDSLRLIAWLIDDWPNGLGSRIGRDLLWRGLSHRRNRFSHHVLPHWKGHPWSPSPHDFAPGIVVRLRRLLEV
jgi:TniQ